MSTRATSLNHPSPRAVRPAPPPHPTPLGRIFGAGEDPLTWSFPIGRVLGVHLRLHAVVPLWAGAEILACYGLGGFYFMHGVCAAFAFIALAIGRELAKLCLARAQGSDADQVVICPLGGLSSVSRAGNNSPLASEAGGLLAGMILWPLLMLAAWLVGIPWSYLTIHPFGPHLSPLLDARDSLLRAAVWWLYYANMVQVLINLLLPMLPLDAGRMLFAHATARRGPFAAAELAGRVGAFGAVALLIAGATADQSRLIAIGVIGFLATVSEVRRSQFPAELKSIHPPRPPALPRPAKKPPAPPRRSSLDDLLSKIARRGLASLDEVERASLRSETERSRRRQARSEK